MAGMTARIEQQDETTSAYLLPLRTELAEEISDMTTWRLADEIQTVLIAIAKARQGKILGEGAITSAQRLADYATELRDEILTRVADEDLSIGDIAVATDVSRSTAQSRLAAARGRTWKRGWLITNDQRNQSHAETTNEEEDDVTEIHSGGDVVFSSGAMSISRIGGTKVYDITGAHKININGVAITLENTGDVVVAQGYRVTTTPTGLRAEKLNK